MQCRKCGSPLNPGERYCPNCGTPAAAAPDVPATPYEAPAAPYGTPAAPAVNPTPILVLGILSLVFAYFGLIGLILGIIGLSKAKAYRRTVGAITGKAQAGKILSTIGLVIGIVMTAFWAFFLFIALLAANAGY